MSYGYYTGDYERIFKEVSAGNIVTLVTGNKDRALGAYQRTGDMDLAKSRSSSV
jgi:hypothetical protein